ncbi:hypothetical protein Zmor_000171 [Zophobas morio]|uniref:Uncharacterized protein n=1 Tax=Zophobas morio TaxID=2755281 RepID=A0AA38J3W3_9CUCU|nr:hypothetical protein Zmor_000171 [Zophobas morio]
MFAVIHARIRPDHGLSRYCSHTGNCAPDFRLLRDVISMSDREVANLLAGSITHLHTAFVLRRELKKLQLKSHRCRIMNADTDRGFFP